MPKTTNIKKFFSVVKTNNFTRLLKLLTNLKEEEPSLNKLDDTGLTILHHIARNLTVQDAQRRDVPGAENFPQLPELVETLIAKGAKTDILSSNGIPALHYTIIHKCVNIFKVLLPYSNKNYITSNNTPAPSSWSLLHYAVWSFNNEIFSALLKVIDLNFLYQTNAEGYTPMAFARHLVQSGKLPSNDLNTIIEMVKNKVNFPPNFRMRDLIFKNNYDELAKRLAEGGDPNEMGTNKKVTDSSKEEPLIFIAVGSKNQERNVRFTTLLLRYSVVEAVNGFNESAFERALYFNNDTRVLELLLAAKFSPQIQNKNGCTILHTACTHKNMPLEMVTFIFKNIITEENFAIFFKANNVGDYPIHRAAANPLGSGALEFLIKKYPKAKDIIDINLNTPLHIAIDKGNTFCIETLLRLGGDLDLKNKAGKTCRELLQEKEELSSLLDSAFQREEGEIFDGKENSPDLKRKNRNNDDDTEEESDIRSSVKKRKKTDDYKQQLALLFEGEIRKLTKDNQLLTEQLQQKDKQITDLETDKIGLITELSSIKELIDNISQQNEELHYQNSTLQEANGKLKLTNGDLTRQKTLTDNTFYINYKQQTAIQELQAHIQKLTAEIATLKTENANLKFKRKEYNDGLSFLLDGK